MEFMKSGLACFFNNFKENINRIRPETANYISFVKLLKNQAKKSILRGHRHSYTPHWTKECDTLLNKYEKYGTEVNANRLIGLLDKKRRKRWLEEMDNLDFIYSSRESWSLLTKLVPRRLHIHCVKYRRMMSQTYYSKPQT